MMGHTHAASGIAVWLAVTTSSQITGVMGHRLSVMDLAFGAVVCGGAALVPDLDHPEGNAAKTFGIITESFAKGLAFISGGHRHATHSALGLGIAMAGFYFATKIPVLPYVLMFLCSSFAFRAIGIAIPGERQTAPIVNLVLSVAMVAAVLLLQAPLWWMPWAIGIGYATHLAGDCLTKEGCMLLWPDKHKYRLTQMKTNGVVEKFVVAPVLLIAVIGLVLIRVKVVGG